MCQPGQVRVRQVQEWSRGEQLTGESVEGRTGQREAGTEETAGYARPGGQCYVLSCQ